MLFGLVVIVAACGDSTEKNAATTSTNPANRTVSEPVPRSLGQVESGAEDAIDFARAGDRERVIKAARNLRRAAGGSAAADLRGAGAPQAEIALLQDRARRLERLASRGDFLQVSLLANQVSALMPPLYARFKDPVPAAVLQLDYLDREAQLRSLAGDQRTVRAAVGVLSSTWAKLRAQVIDAGGEKVAASFTRHVRVMQRLARSSDRAALQKEAVAGLELVDQLEDAFRKQ